jgi:serpin B
MHLASNPVLSSFTQINQNYYGAEIGDLAGAPADVNTWVSQQTNGLITQILSSDFDPTSAVAVVVNTLYFKGIWTTAFDASHTAAAPFTRADGSQVTAQMMHQSGSYDYSSSAGFSLLRLPYGSGRMSMIILLPEAGTSLNTVLAGVTAESLNTSVSGLQSSAGAIALPRFSTSYGASLMAAFASLGMSADNYPGIASGASLSDVEHKTVVEVDESGTVAAAATGGTVTAVAQQGFIMTVDHPFFYAIRDDKTGLLLFVGEMMDPTAS